MTTKSNTDTLYQKFEAELPEYVEAAAREIHGALHTFLRHDSIPNPAGGPDLPWVSEIRIPVARETNPKTGKIYTNVEAAWFDTAGIDDIAAELASRWCQPPELLGQYDKHAEGGIYWCINPITPAYLENYGSTLQRRKTGTARDVDAVARYWLPIDADALRKDPITGAPLGVVSSTDAEKADIARLIAQVREYLVGDLGWPEPVRVDTGNGYADYYALPGLQVPRCPDPDNPGCLKYDAANDTLIRDVIHAISYKFTGALGSIDDAVFNPSRIMKVPGTWARKAQHTQSRPHRASKILYTPTIITPVTVEQLRVVAIQLAKPTTKTRQGGPRPGQCTNPPEDLTAEWQPGETPPPPGTETVSNGRPQQNKPNGPVEPKTAAERAERIRRARNYLTKVPAAISGQRGHDRAFVGLGKVVRRFALPRDMAKQAIVDWNNRCDPPWSESELAHKLESIYADVHGADDWGQLLTTTTTTTNPVGDTTQDKPKPALEINTKRDQVIDAALSLLPGDPDLYLMSNVLVNLVQVAEEDATLYGGVALRHALGTHVTNVLDADQLSYHLTRTADCYCRKQTKHGESVTKPTHPPDWLLKNLIKFAVKSPLRQLRGIVDAPILRPDGSLHTEAGYDPVTGYFYAPAGPVPPLPDRPAHADAGRAAEDLFEVVHQFPFAGDADKAVWLAGLLTVLARPAIAGPTPGFAFLGNRAGVGKGRLIDILGIIATDRTVPCTSYPETKEEAIKCKVAFALATTPIVHLDNLDEGSVYGHGVIDSAITSTKINDRILGSNTLTKNLELALCWFLSGNNLSPGKDAYRRWLVCNLVTREENPEERPDLKIKDILAYVTSRRTTLLGSALTILKAQRAGGPPDRRLGTPGVVRELGPHRTGAVHWATGEDCCTTRKTAAAEAPERLNKIALLEAWKALPGGGPDGPGVTIEEACEFASPTFSCSTGKTAPEPYPELRRALLRFSPDGKLPGAQTLSHILRSLKEYKIGGLAFSVFGTVKHVAKWYVTEEKTQSPP